jgi:FkbM family methyltransferase
VSVQEVAPAVVTPELLANPPEGVINAYGSLLKLDPEDSLFLGSHDYEVYETKLVLGLVRPGDVAVDVGAMIGYYTMLLANTTGPTGRVYAFEPDQRNFALLSENVAMNGYDHVTLKQAVVGASAGKTKLYPAPEQFRGDNRAYGVDGGERVAVEVDMVSVDETIDGPVDLIKIDVQGYEGHVLEGMRDVLGRSPEMFMLVEYAPCLLIEAGTDPGAFLADLVGLGFGFFEIDEPNKTMRGTDPVSLLARSADESGDLYTEYTNLLCVKEQR